MDESLLLGAFENESEVCPLVITPSAFEYNEIGNHKVATYTGVHLVDTATLLSLKEPHIPIRQFAINSKGESVSESSDEAIACIHSIELYDWCRILIEGYDNFGFVPVFLPTVYLEDSFRFFEQVTLGMPSKRLCAAAYQEVMTRNILVETKSTSQLEKISTAFSCYYHILQGIHLAETNDLVFEADFLASVRPNIANTYPALLEMIRKETATISARLATTMYFEIGNLVNEQTKILEDSNLQEQSNDEDIDKLEDELLRLRRSLF